MKYYLNKIINSEFESAVEQVIERLTLEGFGVLTQIDIHNKLKENLNVDFRKYKILGACNPTFAYKALLKESKIGLMLPCNVIVEDLGNNKVEISTIDPMASLMLSDNLDLLVIATEIKDKLRSVLKSL